MINRTYKYLALVALGLPMLSSCIQDDFHNGENRGMQNCRISVNVMTDLATTHTRAVDMTPGAIVNLNSIWIGVYDVNTGAKLNDEDIIVDMNYRQTATGSKLMDAIQVEFQQDWNSDVCVVGVANFDGVTSTDGTSLEELLSGASTWEKFSQISVDTESAYSDLHGTTTPLLMGYLLNEDDSPLAQIDQFEGFSSINLDHTDADDHIFFNPSEYYNDINGKVEITDRYLRLRKLVSQINVNITEGEGISVSNIKFKKMNMPASVYLAERVTDIENLAASNSALSPNSADLNPSELYLSDGDEDWTVANVGQYGFTFQQFENKHWSKTAASYDDRGKRNLDGSFSALGDDFNNPNVYTSYFVMSMNVVDHIKGISADVEYIIPEGYCSDEEGNPLYDGTNIIDNKIFKDFSCFRNTDYTYNIKIEGINNILVNVQSSAAGHFDDQKGVMWEIKYPEGINTTDLIPITGGEYQFVLFDSESDPEKGGEGVCFRISGYDEDNMPVDIYYNSPDVLSTQFNSVWSPTVPGNSFYDINELDKVEIPATLLNAFKIIGSDNVERNVLEFVKSNPGPGVYTVKVASNQGQPGDRALYIANRKDLLTGVYDSDRCSGMHTLYGAVQMGPHLDLDMEYLEMYVGEDAETLTATLTPANVSPRTLSWSSSNANVATVSATGAVSPKAAGYTTITVSYNGGLLKKSCLVKVKDLRLSPATATLFVGESTSLTATPLPEDPNDNLITWSSSNTSVATVDAKGTVKAGTSSTGTSTIKASYGRKTQQATVTVENISLSVSSMSLIRNTSDNSVAKTFTVTIPKSAPKYTISVTSSYTSRAAVSYSTTETTKADGSRTVTVTVTPGATTGNATITVKYGNASKTLTATVTAS